MFDLKGRHFASGPPDEKRQAATDNVIVIWVCFERILEAACLANQANLNHVDL